MKTVILFLSLLCSALLFAQQKKAAGFTYSHGAVVRGDSTKKEVALVFTADEFGEGLPIILSTLKGQKVKAGFFFTGRFYRNPSFQKEIKRLEKEGHYLGPHSDEHLLYCDWQKRDSLLVMKDSFEKDIAANLKAMTALKLPIHSPHFFIPPFEWWNDSIAAWSKEANLKLFNFTPGLRTAADYTWPQMGTAYKNSNWILAQLKERITAQPTSLKGAIILVHAGADARRKDKLYNRLKEMIGLMRKAGYVFVRVDMLLEQ